MISVVKYNDFDIEKLSIENVDVTKFKSKSKPYKFISIQYDDKPLYLETPKMHCPFGVNNFEGSDRYNISFNLVEDMENIILTIEDKIVNHIYENQMKYFSKNAFKLSNLKELFNSSIKINQNKNYSNLFKCQLDNADSDLYDRKTGEEMEITKENTMNTKIQSIIRIPDFYIMNKMYGISYKIDQMLLDKNDNTNEKIFLFTDDI